MSDCLSLTWDPLKPMSCSQTRPNCTFPLQAGSGGVLSHGDRHAELRGI